MGPRIPRATVHLAKLKMSQAEDETLPLEDHDVIATYTSRHVDAETQLLEVLEDYLPHPLLEVSRLCCRKLGQKRARESIIDVSYYGMSHLYVAKFLELKTCCRPQVRLSALS